MDTYLDKHRTKSKMRHRVRSHRVRSQRETDRERDIERLVYNEKDIHVGSQKLRIKEGIGN